MIPALSESAAVPPVQPGAATAVAIQHDITELPDGVLPAVVESLDGGVLTRGVAIVRPLGGLWTARVSQLDRPGVIASMFFAKKGRDVVLRMDDGRHARARIAGTSFIAASERVCDLTGVEPLA